MSIDYNSKNTSAGKGGRKSKSFSSFSGVSGPKHQGQRPGARTRRSQWVKSGGGTTPAPTNRGTSGLHLNQVHRAVDTAYGKHSQVTKGGGHTSLKNVHGNPDVQPEC